MINKLETGDILTIKDNIDIEFKGRNYYNISGKKIKYKIYRIEGITNFLPFAHKFVKKRFLFVRKSKDNLSISSGVSNGERVFLLDNFKENLFGKGYSLSLKSLSIFKKTNKRLINIEDYPISAQKIIVQNNIDDYFDNGHIKEYGNDLNSKLLFCRSNKSKIYEENLYKIFCKLNTIGKLCYCGYSLQNPDVKKINYDDVDFDTIKKEVAHRLNSPNMLRPDYKYFVIFPVLFVCPKCSALSVLFSASSKGYIFDTISLGSAKTWLAT